jgi:hypothetical protein
MRSKLLLLIAFLGTSIAFAQCNYSLELNDDFGDGWVTGGNAAVNTGVDVTVAGVTTTYTITTTAAGAQTISIDIPVNNGDAISIDYRSPALPGEGSFKFFDSEDILLFDSGFAATSQMDIYTGNAICPTCPAVDNVESDLVEARDAEISWTNGGGETAWVIEYGESPYTPNGTGVTRAANSNPFTLDGLNPETTYDVYVRSDCGNGEIGSARGPATFTTKPSCPRPTGYNVLAVQANEISMFILSDNREQDVLFEIGVSPYTLGSSTARSDSTAPFLRIDQLMSNTTYDLYVRYDCGATDGFSAYSDDPLTFTTPQVCDDVSDVDADNLTFTTADLSWTAGNAETLWEIEYGPAPLNSNTSTTVVATATTFQLTALSSATDYEYCVSSVCGPLDRGVPVCGAFTTPSDYCGADPLVDSGGVSGNYSNNELITYTICPDNPGDLVSVDFSQFDLEQRSNTQCADFLLIYDGDSTAAPAITTVNGNAQWCYNRASGIGTGDLLGVNLLSTSPSGCLTFVFDSNGSNTEAGFTAAVTCAAPPACPAPDQLSALQVYGEGASLIWNSNGTETEWEVEVQPAGTAQGTAGATYTATVSNEYDAVSGLAVSTSYDAYIRANCSGGDQSAWIGPVSFTTNACPVVATPYTGAAGIGPGNDFSAFPGDCWYEANATPITGRPIAANSSWDNFDFGGDSNSNGNSALVPIFDSPTVDNDWLISPNFDLGTTGHNMLMIFDIALTEAFNITPSNFGSDDSVSLVISEDNGLNWTVLRTWDESSNVPNTGRQEVVNLQAYSGIVKMGFVSSIGTVSDAAVDIEFYVDSIRIATTASITSTVDLGLKMYPNPTNGLVNISALEDIKTIKVRNLLGQEVMSEQWSDRSGSFNVEQLKSGIYLIEVSTANGRETLRLIKN